MIIAGTFGFSLGVQKPVYIQTRLPSKAPKNRKSRFSIRRLCREKCGKYMYRQNKRSKGK